MSSVLLVDDELGMRELLKRWLLAKGHHLLEARTAEEALDVLAKLPHVAVVVADMQMPGRGGAWLVGELQNQFPDVAVILATADSERPWNRQPATGSHRLHRQADHQQEPCSAHLSTALAWNAARQAVPKDAGRPAIPSTRGWIRNSTGVTAMAAIEADHRGGSIRLRAAALTSALIAVALIAVIAFTFYAIRLILLRSGEGARGRSRQSDRRHRRRAAPGAARRSAQDGRRCERARAADDAVARGREPRGVALQAALRKRRSASDAGILDRDGKRVYGIQIPPTGGTVPFADALPQGTGLLPYSSVNGEVVSEVVVDIRAGGEGTAGSWTSA